MKTNNKQGHLRLNVAKLFEILDTEVNKVMEGN